MEVLNRIYPYYKGECIGRRSDGYQTAAIARREMKWDEIIKDFEATLPEDFWNKQLYVCKSDVEYTESMHTIDIVGYNYNSSCLFHQEDYIESYNNYIKSINECLISKRKNVKYAVDVRYPLWEKRVFLRNIKDEHLNDLIKELRRIEQTDLSDASEEELQHCAEVYKELDRLEYYPEIFESDDNYHRLLNKFILENVEFREIHAHENYVLVKPEHHKKVYPESKELF